MSNENTNTIIDLLQKIEDIVDEGKSSIFSGGKISVDGNEIKNLIDEIRNSFPTELQQARKIASERKLILQDAAKTAELKVKQAEIQAAKLVEENEITQRANAEAEGIIENANAQAEDILRSANDKGREITTAAKEWCDEYRKSASIFVDTILFDAEELLGESVKNMTQDYNKIKNAQMQLKSVMAKRSAPAAQVPEEQI